MSSVPKVERYLRGYSGDIGGVDLGIFIDPTIGNTSNLVLYVTLEIKW